MKVRNLFRHYMDVFFNKFYLPTVINRCKSQKCNHNMNFSLLCGNCMGGYIYHQLGLPFLSPTINLMMSQVDLLRLVLDLPHYQNSEFIQLPQMGGVIRGQLDDIVINFTHYTDFDAAVATWKKRFSRLSYDNLYIIATDRDGIDAEDIKKYAGVHCKKLIVFTAEKYNLPYCFFVDKYAGQKCVGGEMLRKTIFGKWEFEKYFDYVSWLNSDDPNAEHFKLKE